ncbi:MAG: hypothetical protein AB1627_01670 [Chloroflexota bacterium]
MRGSGWLLAGILVAGLLSGVPVTLARFTDAAAADAALTTGSLLPPTGVAATGGASASLTWTPTTSAGAAGYRLLRSATAGSGYGVVGSVTPAGAIGTTDSPGAGTWYYVLRSYLGSWTSADSNEASVTIGAARTGFQPCASNTADTGGDDDGYEARGDDGCAADGAFARDAASGTNTVDSCANAGKDRHRFWGYALGLPATVTSIDGIAVRLVAGMSNSGGTTRICVELSWDAGTTWTAPQSVPLSGNALASYDLGSPTDTWGRAWTAGELDPANLRLRLTDVTTHANKTFRLDGVSIEVAWTP